MDTKLSYDSAFTELKEISQEIENETISIDLLAEKVKRASFLISFCQDRLRSTEGEVNNILKQMETKAVPE